MTKRGARVSHTLNTPSISSLLHRRFAMVALWYCALTLGFLVVLGAFAFYTPAVASHVLFGAPTLTMLTPAEAAHISDVHAVVRDALLIALSAALVLASYWLRYGLDRSLTKAASAMQLALCVLLIPFPWTFTRFHQAFFPQGNWQFAADSWLITHYPSWVFALAAVLWFALSLLALYLLHRKQNR